jgi:predicted membrane chloride channel (bestrophin family)
MNESIFLNNNNNIKHHRPIRKYTQRYRILEDSLQTILASVLFIIMLVLVLVLVLVWVLVLVLVLVLVWVGWCFIVLCREQQVLCREQKKDLTLSNSNSNSNSSIIMSESPEPKKDLTLGGPVRQMAWDDSGMSKILLQCYGSVWPKVLPYCIWNVLLTIGIRYMLEYDHINLTVDSTGHKYMAALMSFLVVTRVKIIYDRYMTQSQKLSDCLRAIRELAQNVCILSARDTSTRAKQWRHDVLYHGIVLLRVTSAILQYRSNSENEPWDVPELSWDLQAQVKECMFLQSEKNTSSGGDDCDARSPKRLAHKGEATWSRTALDESCRAVPLLCFQVRQEIMKQRDGTWLKTGTWDHPCNEETKLLDCIGDFHKAFSSLRVMLTTPMPFPLVQMTKTFLFVWVFRIPFALCHDQYHLISLCIIVFLITFGFFGLEYVAMELADVFGDDPSDMDDLGHAQLAFEDCYITIYKLDGEAWARKLRHSVMGRQNELDVELEDIVREMELEQQKEQEQQQHQQVEAKQQALSADDNVESRGILKKKKNRVSKLLKKKKECAIS